MSQVIAEPITDPATDEPVDVQGETPAPEIDHGWFDTSDILSEFMGELEKRMNRIDGEEYLLRLTGRLIQTLSVLASWPQSCPNEPQAPTLLDDNGELRKGKIVLNSTWKLYNVLRGLENEAHRLQAASTVIACGEPDERNPMDGLEACAVENILDRVIERLNGYRKAIAEVSREIDVQEPIVVPDQPAEAPAPTNGLPEWSDPRWPQFQRVVAALPGVFGRSNLDELFEKLVNAVDETMMNQTDNNARLIPLADLIRDLAPLKGAAS